MQHDRFRRGLDALAHGRTLIAGLVLLAIAGAALRAGDIGPQPLLNVAAFVTDALAVLLILTALAALSRLCDTPESNAAGRSKDRESPVYRAITRFGVWVYVLLLAASDTETAAAAGISVLVFLIVDYRDVALAKTDPQAYVALLIEPDGTLRGAPVRAGDLDAALKRARTQHPATQLAGVLPAADARRVLRTDGTRLGGESTDET